MYVRSLPGPDSGQDDRPGETFGDRRVTVETTFDGAGVLTGDLTPECAAVVTAVLESLSAPAGAEDTRTKEQRYHDGLQEAMRRAGRAGVVLADPAAGRPAGRAEPAAGHRVQQDHPARHPQRSDLAGPAVPVARRMLPLNTH